MRLETGARRQNKPFEDISSHGLRIILPSFITKSIFRSDSDDDFNASE